MKISVIIPTYQRAHTIGVAIRSVLAQTLRAHEIIVVDDGSQDDGDTLLVVQNLQVENRGRNIDYIGQENAGPAAARNNGVRHATGDYVYFLDSDDTLQPYALDLMADAATRHPNHSVIFGRAQNVEGGWSRDYIGDPAIAFGMDNIPSGQCEVFDLLLQTNFIPIGAVMMTRKLALQAPFDETMRHAEDYNLWLSLATHYRFGYVNTVLLNRTIHESNLVGNKLAMGEAVLRILERYQGWPVAWQRISDLNYDLGSAYLKQMRWDKASEHLSRVMPTGAKHRFVLALKRALAGVAA